MIIDNWKLIREKLDFSDKDKFYFIELLQRKKDNPSFPSNNRLIKYYFVYSLEYYDKIEEEVKKLSDCTGARVYILLNRRSYKKCALNILSDAAQMCIDSNYQHFPKLISSVIGKYADEPNKTWIVDIDDDQIVDSATNLKKSDLIKEYIDSAAYPLGSKWLFDVPTLNGVHLITKPFDTREFKTIHPDIDIHKDNPTLLYFKHVC